MSDELPAINVVGHLRASSGLGNTARLFIEVLRAKGHPVVGADIDDHSAGDGAEPLHGLELVKLRDLPFKCSLMVVALAWLPRIWLRHGETLLHPERRTAGLVFWELSTLPSAWHPSLRMFDAVLACSHFVRQTVETAMPDVPTVFAEHPLPRLALHHDRNETRRRFNIPLTGAVFCTSFDSRSGFVRKNARAAVKAWSMAFPDASSKTCLVLKINDDPAAADARDYAAILAEVNRDPRIIVIAERLSHREVMELFDSCDVFVSLHRSEGLGLVPMEAMSLGKLVIATGYSGNTTFMTEQNSMAVPYTLVEPVGDVPFFHRRFAGKNASWAEPDTAAAAQLMRAAVQDSPLRLRLAAQAKADIALRQESAWAGTYFDQMFQFLQRSHRMPMRARLLREIRVRELSDPTIRAKNLGKVFDKLARFRRPEKA